MGSEIPATADVVIIGGGIHGASAAWHLARKRAGRIAILERHTVASGASGKTGALLRQHYTNVPEARLAHLSLEVFRQWPEIVGGDCGHDPCGLVVTVDNGPGCERNMGLMHRNVAMQRSIGVDTSVITAGELRSLQPFVNSDDIEVVAYEPTSGYVDAVAANRSMIAAALRHGASLFEGVEVLGLTTDRAGIAAVETDRGVISTRTVLCAAGPWSTRLVASAGVIVPITSLRVQIAIVHRPMELDAPHFIYLDMAAGMFTRPWLPGRSLIGVGGGDQHDAVDPDNWDERNDRPYPAIAIAAAARRIPAMARASYLHGHAGLYDMTPDAHPILGGTSLDGLFIAAGFSGAGFKKGPAVGLCMAELICEGRATTVDLGPFRLSRFDDDGWKRPWSDTEYTFSSNFGHKL